MAAIAAGRLAQRGATALLLLAAACQSPTAPQPLPSSPRPPTGPPQALACGIERWAIKTLSDPEVAAVDLTPIPTTIGALNARTARCSALPDRRIGPDEFRTFEVIGRVTLVRPQDDRDYHLVLTDAATGESIVTEVVDAACSGAVDSPHRQTLDGARASFEALGGSALIGRTVRLRGVGFYDFDHRQTGRSRSCMELHPVLMLVLVG